MKYAALLRGVNVGGKNKTPMKQLAELFLSAGCRNVSTYIQSGNVVFTAPTELLDSIPPVIAAGMGFPIPMVFRTAAQLSLIAANNPFLSEGVPERSLHVSFLSAAPTREAIARLDPNRSPPDRFHVEGQEIYFCMPNGMGCTKLTSAYLDSKLGAMGTVRNWATLRKLVEMTASG